MSENSGEQLPGTAPEVRPPEIKIPDNKSVEPVSNQPANELPLTPEEQAEYERLKVEMIKEKLGPMLGDKPAENPRPPVEPKLNKPGLLKTIASKIVGGVKRIINIATLGIVFRQPKTA